MSAPTARPHERATHADQLVKQLSREHLLERTQTPVDRDRPALQAPVLARIALEDGARDTALLEALRDGQADQTAADDEDVLLLLLLLLLPRDAPGSLSPRRSFNFGRIGGGSWSRNRRAHNGTSEPQEEMDVDR